MGSQHLRSDTFSLDTDNSNKEDLVVDIAGKGSVIIKSNSDGVSVDIYPLHVVDEPLFTGYVLNEEFYEDDND